MTTSWHSSHNGLHIPYTLFAAEPQQELHPLPSSLTQREILEQACRIIAPGVEHRTLYFKNPFGDGPVNVNMLIVYWKEVSRTFSLGIASCGGIRKRPSQMGEAAGALAIVNGGYHLTTDPTIPYFPVKINGIVLPGKEPRGDTALAFGTGEMPVIDRFSKELLDKSPNVISADGITDFQHDPNGKVSRAPRTFIGQSASNQVTVIAVADGRTPQSVGVDFYGACMLVVPFGCEKVLSLDGGGSSVMAIRKGAGNPSGEARPTPPTPLEIVSNPCDNGKFDAGGERRVCDGIMLIDRR